MGHFLFNGRISEFNVTPRQWFRHVGGFRRTLKAALFQRFEFLTLTPHSTRSLRETPRDLLRGVNILLSQLSTVNNQVTEIVRLTLIRLYLIRSRRGRFQAVGKPTRGQRTWSNA